jgi:hypothetical protein
MTPLPRLRFVVARLWALDRPLTATGLLMIGAFGASIAGLVLDPRLIAGAPAWLKPVKFAISTSIYSLTLAWVFSYLESWPRVRRVVSWTTAIVFVLEVALIDLQAWRGTTSHFNASTAFDAALFATMGIAIVTQTLISILVAIALWRERFARAAIGWTLRLGMAITIVGAASGGLMTRPTTAQLAQVHATGRMPVAGAHTVGAPDGGPGLPLVGWSRDHGDLRIPHFVGLHAIQVLPLIAFAIARITNVERRRVRLVLVTAGSYAALFGLLLWQALRGQSTIAPDATTVAAFAVWMGTTLVAGWTAAHARPTGTLNQEGPNRNRNPEPQELGTRNPEPGTGVLNEQPA